MPPVEDDEYEAIRAVAHTCRRDLWRAHERIGCLPAEAVLAYGQAIDALDRLARAIEILPQVEPGPEQPGGINVTIEHVFAGQRTRVTYKSKLGAGLTELLAVIQRFGGITGR